MKKNIVDYFWILKILIFTFCISICFTFISNTAIPKVGILIGILITIIFIFIGVIFDMIGIAVATADEAKFHSMSAKKVKGSKMALKLKKNADKVSSFCNDVIGDICGIVSGSTGTTIAIKIIEKYDFNNLITTLIVMGLISAFTIGGKALEKGYAMKKSDKILFSFAKVLSIFSKE